MEKIPWADYRSRAFLRFLYNKKFLFFLIAGGEQLLGLKQKF